MKELTASLVVDGRDPRSPALAPDGRRVCYVLGEQLWIADIDGDVAPSAVARGSRPRWSGDSLFYLSDQAQLHRLTSVAALTSCEAGIIDHLPLEGSSRVALLAYDGLAADPVVVGEQEPRARLRMLDLSTGAVTTPRLFDGRHVVELKQRPSGGPLAVLTQASADNDSGPRTGRLHLFDPDSGAAVELGPVGVAARSLAWWLSPDGWHVGYIALTPPGLQAGTAVFDLALDSGVLRNRTEGLAMCPTELHQTDASPLVVFASGLDTTVARLDPPTTLLRHPGRLHSLSATTAGIAVIAGSRYEPANVHVFSAGRLRQITHTRAEWDDVTLGTQQPLAYRAADGLSLDGLLVLPPSGTAPFPLVTIVHGGPYERYADSCQLFWFPSAQWLATAGYAVFLPNPRGGQGHGHEFAAAVAGRVGQEEWSDIETGIDMLVADGVADPERLGIAGWSHGGFMSAWAISQTDRFRAALVGAGIVDWGMLAATGENGQFEAALGGSTGWSGIGPHPHDAVSPISYAGRIKTPVLILHGAEDTNVPLGQAVYFHRALRQFGVEHEFVVYPREGHGFQERNHKLDVMHRTRAWFGRWLRP